MNRRQALVSDSQATELMQPGEGAFHHPPCLAQIAAMASATSGNLMAYALPVQGLPMLVTVVPAIGLHALRFAQWPSAFARNWGQAFEQGHELRNIVAIGLGQNPIEREALRIDEKVVFAPRLAAIGWVRSSCFPPCTARTEALSGIPREKSSWSAPRSLASSTWCNRVHTPTLCQARKRRQHVMPEPHPISWGSISQGIPDCNTNRMPASTRRSSRRLRPGCRLRRRTAGNSGWIISHSSSSTSSRAISPRYRKSSQVDMTTLFSFC
jgi:hypothetical protein